jgi:c-di-GMP-binding flagellar brake protein YcgR
MESRSDFLIRSPEKIISKLSVLVKNKNLLNAAFGERSNTFVTTILEINKKDNVFICDGCDEELIEEVLASPKIWFKTEHLGAMVAFDTAKVAKIKYQGILAFAIPIPDSMRWIEQREFYRVKTPVSTSSCCQLQLKDKETVNLKLYDISLRGFSVLNVTDDISDLLVPGAQFEKSKLILEGKEEIIVSFEIRSKFIINPNNLNKTEKIGCKFTQITPAFENAVHGYMLDIEREILKKRSEQERFARH